MPKRLILPCLALALLLCVPARAVAAPDEGVEEVAGTLLLITGVDRYHPWNENSQYLRKLLEDNGFEVTITEDPWVVTTPGMERYDGIVMVMNTDDRWPGPVEQAFAGLIRGGMGIGIIHSADNCFPGWREFEEMVGLLWRIDDKYQAGHDHYGPYTVKVTDREHFITRGMEDFPVTDELYRDLAKFSDFHVLAEAFSRDKQRDYPIIMTKTYGKGRVFHTVLGHNVDSMLADGFQRTTVRGMLWAIDREQYAGQ